MNFKPHALESNSVIVDSETQSLHRGSGVTEISVFDLDTRQAHEFLLTPNMVQTATQVAQENTRLASSSLDAHRLVEPDDWIDVARRNLELRYQIPPGTTNAQVQLALEKLEPFSARAFATQPHLRGEQETSVAKANRDRALRDSGVSQFLSQVITPRKLLEEKGALEQLISGKTVWLANAAFDSSQIGSLIGGLAEEGVRSGIADTLETRGTTSNPLYVTGAKVTAARVKAQQSGDWTGVWKAYLANQPKAGETAVRDIQDVLRAMSSYGQKLGLTSSGDVYWGSALDIVYRLMGSVDSKKGREFLTAAEAHRSTEDSAKHSKHVLNKALHWTAALQQVEEQTPEGLKLLEDAAKGKGDLFEAATFFARRDLIKPEILEQSLLQRVGRAEADFLAQGVTYQVDGWSGVSSLTQQTPSDGPTKVSVLTANRVEVTDQEQLIAFLHQQKKYGDEPKIRTAAEGINAAVAAATDTPEQPHAKQSALATYLDAKTHNNLARVVEARSSEILSTFNPNISGSISKAKAVPLQIKPTTAIRNMGVGVAALATAGIAWSLFHGNQKEKTPSVVTYDYEQWLAHQAEFNGLRPGDEQMQGMSERGVAGATRKYATDFGSPYQGAVASQHVFDKQKEHDQRETLSRQVFKEIHFTPGKGPLNFWRRIPSARHLGNTTLDEGESVGYGYKGLQSNRMKRLDLSTGNWKLSAVDADTILLKQGGMRGAIKSLFGANEGFSFRLAGIDAPEDGGRNAAQPGSGRAVQVLNSLLADKSSAELVYDPQDVTYGRNVGVFFAGGKNLSYEMVRRGAAGFLPYGSNSDSIINYTPMAGMERQAVAAQKGMWAHPYWQTYRDYIDQGGLSLTFNKLPNFNIERRMRRAEARAEITANPPSHYATYMDSLKNDISSWTSTGGTRNLEANRMKASKQRDLNKHLTIGNLNPVAPARNLQTANKQRLNMAHIRRRERQAEEQRRINNTLFNSQQNHTMM